jgi:hypothetical protein
MVSTLPRALHWCMQVATVHRQSTVLLPSAPLLPTELAATHHAVRKLATTMLPLVSTMLFLILAPALAITMMFAMEQQTEMTVVVLQLAMHMVTRVAPSPSLLTTT